MLDPTTYQKLTPAQQWVVRSMLRQRAPSGAYTSIGQPIPGVPRQPHRAYRLVFTGRTEEMLHHKLVRRNGEFTREAYKLQVKIFTLQDMRVDKRTRQLRRVMKGLPANP